MSEGCGFRMLPEFGTHLLTCNQWLHDEHESGKSLNLLLEKVMLATTLALLRGRKASSECVFRRDFFDHELLQVAMPSRLLSDSRESVPAKGLSSHQ